MAKGRTAVLSNNACQTYTILPGRSGGRRLPVGSQSVSGGLSVERLRKTPKKDQQAEGKQICIEIIQQVREIEGVSGVHIMAYRQEELVAQIVEDAGLLPRPRRRAFVDPLDHLLADGGQ